MRTADGMFEAENLTLGAASYHVIPTEKWAVSNVGLFAERSSQTYLQNSLSVITNTDSSELYQTSRLSPSSLRYYGLGLENGPYTITLYFAENEMTKSWEQTWKSLGRRVFDIYIQVTNMHTPFCTDNFFYCVVTLCDLDSFIFS